MVLLGLVLLFYCVPGMKMHLVSLSPSGISLNGEQSMHLPMGEEQENQTREKIIYPQSVFAAPRERRDLAQVFMSLP